MAQRYYIHPMAFGAGKNPGYGHIEVVKYEDYAALENLLIAVVAAVGPCDIPDHLLDALCKAGVLE